MIAAWITSRIISMEKETISLMDRRYCDAPQRRDCLAAKRSLHRSRIDESDEFATYIALKKGFKLPIKKSEEKSWKQLIMQIGKKLWGLPYVQVTQKLIGKKSIESVSFLERSQLIVDTLFPKHSEITWVTLKPLNAC